MIGTGSAIAPALMDFASWVGDIAGRAARDNIDAEQALSEMAKYKSECEDEIATVLHAMASDRAKIDALVAKLPKTPPPAGGAP